MKKKLNYREKLIELADIYDVKEIKDYVKRRKNLTSGQLELILRKNKIIIPKDYKTSFFKENFTKPLGKFSKQIVDLKDDSSKSMSRLTRRMDYFKEDSYRKFNNVLYGTWKKAGIVGIEFLNIIPKLGKTYYNFFANFFTELFNGIYSQNFNKNKAGKAIIVFFITIGLGTVIFSSFDTFDKIKTSNENNLVKDEKLIKKPEINKPEIKKNENAQKKELQAKKEIKKQEPQAQKQNKAQKQKEKVAEIILPDLNFISPPSLATAGLIFVSSTSIIFLIVSSSSVSVLIFFDLISKIGPLFFSKKSFIWDIIKGFNLSQEASFDLFTDKKFFDNKTNSTPS